MEKLWLLLFFIAPVLQIILSVPRYRGKVKLSMAVITLLMFVLGYAISIAMEYINSPSHSAHPQMPMVLYYGIMITNITVLPIGIIAGLLYYLKPRLSKSKVDPRPYQNY